LCGQHIKVGLCHAQDQILLHDGECRFAGGDREFALFVILPGGDVEQRLRQRQRIAARFDIGDVVALCVLVSAANADQWQEVGTALYRGFLACSQIGTGAGIHRIIDQCFLIELQQIDCLRLQCKKSACDQYDELGFGHCFSDY